MHELSVAESIVSIAGRQANILAALAEARKRGLLTVGLVGRCVIPSG